MSDVIRINIEADSDAEEGRFSRFHLIPWWEQEKLSQAKIVVVGAGALGNEIVKNLALLGAGNVFIADFDVIENSNLSRSVLFREKDNGKPKVEVAAESASDIFPGMNVQSWNENVVYDLGLGVYDWADIVIGGLDNREARLSINQGCYKVNTPWIDGAIEKVNGVARMFMPPDGPCYECTMNDRDWELLEMRRSCNLLSREEMEQGKVPTTPTTAAVVAGVQVQEAVKHLHGKSTLAGKGYVFNGLDQESYQVQYVRKDSCYSHERCEPMQELDGKASEITVGALLQKAQNILGPDAILEFNNEILHKLRCADCRTEETLFMSLGKVTEKMGKCPECGEMRNVDTLHSVYGDEDFLDHTLSDIGIPAYDIVGARNGAEECFFKLGGDAKDVLGELYAGGTTGG